MTEILMNISAYKNRVAIGCKSVGLAEDDILSLNKVTFFINIL